AGWSGARWLTGTDTQLSCAAWALVWLPVAQVLYVVKGKPLAKSYSRLAAVLWSVLLALMRRMVSSSSVLGPNGNGLEMARRASGVARVSASSVVLTVA